MIPAPHIILSLCALALFFTHSTISAADSASVKEPVNWPHIHGPSQANASAPEATWLTEWKPNIQWKANVGTGFSAVVISGDHVISVGNTNDTDTIYCLSAATGKELWKYSYTQPLNPDLYKGGPNATPTIHDGRVYAMSRLGDVFCLQLATGALVWKRQLKEEEKLEVSKFGFSGSPVIYKETVLLNAGESGIVLRRDTGKTLWLSGTKKSAYSTPVVYDNGTEPLVLVFHGKGLAAHAFTDGTKKWNFPWKTAYEVNAATPLIDGNHVFISSGYGKGSAFIDMSGPEPKQVWKSKVFESQMAGPVLVGEHLYGVSAHVKKPGELRCVELKTGKLLWAQAGFGNGSVLAVGAYVLALSETGELVMAEARSDKYVELGRMKVLDETCWTQPTIANGQLYVRNSAGDIVCLRMY